MLILTIRSDKPESELALYEDDALLVAEQWAAHRQLAETIHLKIRDLLQGQQKDWGDIEGLVVYRGPGSFTGLRIGLSVANALASSNNIPIVGTSGDDWLQTGLQKLAAGSTEKQVLPEYGGEIFITAPKK